MKKYSPLEEMLLQYRSAILEGDQQKEHEIFKHLAEFADYSTDEDCTCNPSCVCSHCSKPKKKEKLRRSYQGAIPLWKMKKGILFPLAGFFPKNIPVKLRKDIRCQSTGEFREPKKGEWFISGAIPEAYQAPNDLSTKYWIGTLVRVNKTVIVREDVVEEYGNWIPLEKEKLDNEISNS